MNTAAPIPNREPLLAARGVWKSYAGCDAPVLKGVDVAIRGGECVFLAGPSGSGKSTLLSILGCILTPDEGLVSVCGQNVGQLDEARRAQLRRERIGFVFQRFHLIRGLTALDNVCVPLTLCGRDGPAVRARGAELLARVGLADKLHSYPQRMSSGQCQRVALARALAADPDIILADEPTASLDAANGRQIIELLRDLTARAGKAAAIVTHDHRIFPYADRVLQLENGVVQDEAPSPAPAPPPATPTFAPVPCEVSPCPS